MHPGAVGEMLIYGSKARGQAHAESDLDVLLIVNNRPGTEKRVAKDRLSSGCRNRGLAGPKQVVDLAPQQ